MSSLAVILTVTVVEEVLSAPLLILIEPLGGELVLFKRYVAIEVNPALSVAVTVIVLLPLFKSIEALQVVEVYLAVPLFSVALFFQLTLFMPLVESEALPLKVMVELIVV